MLLDSPLMTGSAVVSGSLYVKDLIYGTLADGGGGTGAGFPFSGSADITGSLTVVDGIISGDGSGLTNVTVASATTLIDTFTGVTSKTVLNSFTSSNLLVSVYDHNSLQIQPASLKVTDSEVVATFSSPTTGRIVIAKGGHLIAPESASVATTASYADYAVTASYAISASHEITYELSSSYAENATSASYALTASFALNAGGGAGAGFPFSGSADITGSLYVSGGNISGSFVGDGSGLTGIEVAEVATVTDTFTNALTASIVHNFNSKNVNVTTYYDNDELFLPQKITTTDVNTVTINFNSPTTGRAVVSKGGHIVSGSAILTEQSTIYDTFTNASSKVVTHNFNTKNVLVSVYLDNDQLIIPDSIETTTENTVTITLDQARSGRIVVAKGGHLVSGSAQAIISEEATVTDNFISASSKSVTHNFNTKNVLVQTYLDDDSLIIPSSVITTDLNTVDVTFDQAYSGRVVVGKAGHIVSGSIVTEITERATVTDTFSSTTLKTVTHNFDTKNVFVSVYLSDDTLIQPDSITTTDSNNVTVTFATPRSGRVVVGKAGHIVTGTNSNAVSSSYALIATTATTASFALTASYAENAGGGNVTGSFTNVTSSIVTHNLGTKSIIVQVWDNSDFVINPSSIKADSENQITVTFSSLESGYIVVGS